jgi:hypothetical protein
LKKILLFFILILSSIVVKAQGDYNFSPLAVGFGTSIIRGYTNVAKQDNTLSGNINFNYYYTPYVPLTAELQFGRLEGGSINTDQYKRAYTDNYTSFIVHGDLQFGQFIDYEYSDFLNVLKNVYIGTGFGILDNNVKNQRTNLIPEPGEPVGSYTFPGTDHSIDPLVPLRGGYEFKIYNEFDEPYIRIDIEYEHNIVFGSGLDGYDDPPNHFKHEHPDQYREITLAFKYNFGRIRAATKRIRGYNAF